MLLALLLSLHNVIAGFLRRTWLVAVVTVIVCAAFAARAVAALSDVALAPGAAGAASRAAPAPAPAAVAAAGAAETVAARLPAFGDAFVQRNIFCSSCTPPNAAPGGGSYQGHPAVLIATSLGADPRATVRVVPTEVQGSWGLGEEIPGVGRLDEIHATAIQVADAGGQTKLISLLEAAGPSIQPTPTGNDQAATKQPFEGRYEKVNETTYKVDRSLVRELVMSGSKPGMGTATPVVVDGEVRGIRLGGLGPKSPGRALGLRSGDLVSTIDGVPLRNAQQLLDLFAKLDQTPAVELGIMRSGKPFPLTLQLR
jgi:hypothetical protein